MTLFNNKHVIAAMIVTPVLAFLGYYFVDLMVKEKPQAAVAGQHYKLVAKSNCRYTSGVCDLENGSFKSRLTVNNEGTQSILRLNASHSLDGVTIGLVEQGQDNPPMQMQSDLGDAQSWSLVLNENHDQATSVRVAIVAQDSSYFVETSFDFVDYDTSFEKTF